MKSTILPPCLSSPFFLFCTLCHVAPFCKACFSVRCNRKIFGFADFKLNHFLIFIFHEAKMSFLPMVLIRRKCNVTTYPFLGLYISGIIPQEMRLSICFLSLFKETRFEKTNDTHHMIASAFKLGLEVHG